MKDIAKAMTMLTRFSTCTLGLTLAVVACSEAPPPSEYKCIGPQTLELHWNSATSRYCDSSDALPSKIEVDSSGALSAAGCIFPEGSRLDESCQLVIPPRDEGQYAAAGGAMCQANSGRDTVYFSLYAAGFGPPSADALASGDYRTTGFTETVLVTTGSHCSAPYEVSVRRIASAPPEACAFRCASGFGCYELDVVCDNIVQCEDGSDEFGCGHMHCEGDLACGGDCFDAVYCDGIPQCSDYSDELNCGSGSDCAPGSIVCEDGTCLAARYECNGINECPDGRDEVDCPCPPASFPCPSGASFTCQPSSLRCNGSSECGGYDELHCVCPAEYFDCGTGCVPRTGRCDGVMDCVNGADESNCFF